MQIKSCDFTVTFLFWVDDLKNSEARVIQATSIEIPFNIQFTKYTKWYWTSIDF